MNCTRLLYAFSSCDEVEMNFEMNFMWTERNNFGTENAWSEMSNETRDLTFLQASDVFYGFHFSL